MAEDISTLGFQFTCGDSVQKISKLITTLEKFETVASKTRPAVENLFSSEFLKRVTEVGNVFNNINGGFSNAASSIKELRKSILPITKRLQKLSEIKPIKSETINSFERLADACKKIYDNGNVKVNVSSVKQAGTGGSSVQGAESVRILNDEMIKLNKNTDNLFGKFTRLAQSGVWAMIFKDATSEAIKFGVELAHINSLSMEYNPEKLRSGILNISSVFGRSAKLAEAEYYAYSSGVRGTEQDLTNFTEQMAKTATLIRAGIIPTVDAATAAMNAYGISAKNASELSDLFYMIVKQGKAKGEQLASGLGQVISTAATAGLSLNELGASIASLTKVMSTRNAITYLNNAISKMIKPTKESQLAAKKLGIELGLDAIRASGFANKMQEIHDKTKGSQEALLRIFSDLRGQRAALQLLNKGWGDFQYQLKMFAQKSGVADEAMKILSEDVNFQISRIPDTFNKIKIATGTFVTDFLTIGGALSPVISAFNNMDEKAHKVIGAIVSIAGAYTLAKSGIAAYQAYQAMTIRNSQIISAAKSREIAVSMALIKSLNAESLAREKNVAVSGMSGLNSASGNALRYKNYLNENYQIKSNKAVTAWWFLSDAKAQLKYARSIGDTIAAEKAMIRLKSIERSFIIADTAAIAAHDKILAHEAMLHKANTVELAKQTALQKAKSSFSGIKNGGSVFSALSSGSGFFGGLGHSGISARNEWARFLKYKSMADRAGKTSEILGKSVGKLGFGLGKVAGIIMTALSPSNIIIGGAIAVALGAVDLLFNEGKTIKSIGEKIYNFFTGAFDEIENQKKRIDALNIFDAFRIDVSGFATGMTDWINGISNNSIPKNINELQKYQEATSRALAKLNSAEVRQREAEYTSTIKSADALKAKIEKGFDFSKAVEDASKKFNVDLKIGKDNEVLLDSIGFNDYEFNKYLRAKEYIKSQKKNYDDLTKQLDDARENAEKLRGPIDRLRGEFQKSAEPLIKFYQKNIDTAIEINKMLANQKFSSLSAEDQSKQQMMNVLKYEKQFYQAYNESNSELMKSSVENMINAHNSVIGYAKKQIESGKRIIESIEDDIFNIESEIYGKSASDVAKRAEDILKNGGVSFDIFNQKWDFGKDLEKSYGYVRKAFQLQISEKQKEVDSNRRLADAERQANDNTIKLIQSMDKFKTTAIDAVQVNSVESVKLQSRSFASMANFSPLSRNFQNQSMASQNEYNQMRADYATALSELKKTAQIRTAESQKTKDNLDERMSKFIEDQKIALEDAIEKAKNNLNQISSEAKKQDDIFKSLQKSSEETAKNTKISANVLNGIKVVTM